MSNASGEYVRGEMDIKDQEATFHAFLKVALWSSLIVILGVGYATFTLTMGVHWLPALIGFGLVGVMAGTMLNMGMSWLFTLGGLVALALFIQVLVWLGGAMVS